MEPKPKDERQRLYFEHLRARAQDGELQAWWKNLGLESCLDEWMRLALDRDDDRAENDPVLNGTMRA